MQNLFPVTWLYVMVVTFAIVYSLKNIISLSTHAMRLFRLQGLFARVELSKDDLQRMQNYLASLEYFQRLSEKGKKKFMKRLVDFMYTKEFGGMEGLKLTEEMKVWISASATQLTFGLREHRLLHYHTIKVFPREFFSKLMNRHLKGGTTRSGIIMLSWRDFVDGYEHPHNKYNLGLHEMAHALKLDVSQGFDFDKHFADHLEEWERSGYPEFNRIKSGKVSFLRQYAGENMMEFFAVCVEHFFEAPGEFSQRLPLIYKKLCILLNQDPCNPSADYALAGSASEAEPAAEEMPGEEGYKVLSTHRDWWWPYRVTLMGIFISPYILILFTRNTYHAHDELVWLYFIFAISSTVIQYFLFAKREKFHFGVFLGYNFFGCAPLALSLCLLLNALVSVHSFETRMRMTGSKFISQTYRQMDIIVDDNPYRELPEVCLVSESDSAKVRAGNFLVAKFSVGIFGITRYEGNYIEEK